MMRSPAALALVAIAMGSHPAPAQTPPVQCNAFGGLKDEAEKRAIAVRAALEHKAERKDICALVQRFASAEATVVKFLEQNKSWCGIPDQAIAAAKSNHERTLKFPHRGLHGCASRQTAGAYAQ